MSRAAHAMRPAGPMPKPRQRVKVPSAPAVVYPPGFFTALVRKHNWPPMWQPAPDAARRPRGCFGADMAPENERRRAQGIGWGSGTLPMPGTPAGPAPGMLARPKESQA